MKNYPKTIFWLSVLSVFALALSACGSALPVNAENPTPDVDAARTEAAQTVVAGFTQVAAVAALAVTNTPTALPPTATQPQPTATTEPSATSLPTETLAPLAPPTSTKVVLLPTIQKSDMALLMLRTPAEYAQFEPGETFDVVWTVKNIGKKTWTNDYYMRYYNGTAMHYNGDKRFVKGSVAPGEQTRFIVDMKAPGKAGIYTTSWVLMNDNGEFFYQFFITIEVKNQ